MSHRASLLLFAFVGVVLPGTAQAGDDGESEYELHAALENTDEGGVFSVRGAATGFPDGTLLQINLFVRGNSPRPIEADAFRVAVADATYKVSKVHRGTFAPLSYYTTVEMLLSAQRKGVADWIRREHGLPPGARVTLARSELTVGTAGEQSEFRHTTLVDLRQSVLDFQTLHNEVCQLTLKSAADYEDWKAVKGEMDGKLRARSDELSAYLSRHVAWHEKPLISQLAGVTSELFWALRYHHKKAKKVQKTLKKVGKILDTMLADIDSRLPKREGADPSQQEE